MSSLRYHSETEPGKTLSEIFNYSQAVVVGDVVKVAGQGGFEKDGSINAHDFEGQVNLAFQNVENVLKEAGLTGWEDVFLLRTYATHMELSMDILTEKLKEVFPGSHKPLWTALSVPRLAMKEMVIEIEVEAYVPKK